jgi:hypothetical protein
MCFIISTKKTNDTPICPNNSIFAALDLKPLIRERLTIDDVMTEDEATQTGARAGSSHAVDELESSSKRYRRR